ncbi:MAG: alpha/beta fold hydrolase, partial [Acidimicrobiales bacterium]
TGDRVGSLFMNPGGPGFGAEDMIKGLSQFGPPPLTESFDLVGIDPRGTGKSRAIDCNSDWLDDTLVQLTPDDGFADDVDLYVEDFKEMAAECNAEYGVDYLASITTENAARDIETVRIALGDEPLNFVGYSYGTAIGSVYATLFPDAIRSMVLDGAVPTNPEVGDLDTFGANVEAALVHLDESCNRWSACPVGDVGLLKAIEIVRNQLEENGSIGPLQPHEFEAAVGTMVDAPILYQPVTEGLALALDGNGDFLSGFGKDFLTPTPTGGFVEHAGTFPAIICADGWNIRAGTVPELLDQAERTAAANPNVGSDVEIPCDLWPVTGEGIPAVNYTGAAQILVIGSTHDPITPLSASEQLTSDLGANATLLEWGGSSHTVAFNPMIENRCINDHVLAYLIDGDVPATTFCPMRGLVGIGWEDPEPVVISRVTPGSPAEDAGLRPGDLIVSIDGLPILTESDVVDGAPGDVVEFVVERDGTEIELAVTRGFPVWELWREAD